MSSTLMYESINIFEQDPHSQIVLLFDTGVDYCHQKSAYTPLHFCGLEHYCASPTDI